MKIKSVNPFGQPSRRGFGITVAFMTLATLVTAWPSSIASAQDSVFLIKADGRSGKSSGKITRVAPEGVTVDGELVPSEKIRKITIGREPSELTRARADFDAGRYADCLTKLPEIPDQRQDWLVQDIDFMEAFSKAQISLRGGNISPKEAGGAVGTFLSKHPESYHLYQALEVYGQLIFAFGKPADAAKEFEKLRKVDWLEQRLKGNYFLGRMKELTGDAASAMASYDAILKEGGNDDLTQTYQALARIEKLKLSGLTGDASQALQKLNAIVGDSNHENQLLFGNLKNAIGAVHQKAGNTEEAMMSYLCTQLLYPQATNAHAEAVYRLAKIWPALDDNQRANEARELLKSRYRNSYWSTQL